MVGRRHYDKLGRDFRQQRRGKDGTEKKPERPSRAAIILGYLPFVQRQAERLARRLSPNIEADDLFQAGCEALVHAHDQLYDPKQPQQFEHYVMKRIRGAMIDEVRRSALTLQRGTRKKLQRVEETRRTLKMRLRRDPSLEEIAKAMGVADVDSLHKLVAVTHVPFDEIIGLLDEGKVGFPSAKKSTTSEAELHASVRAISELPSRQAQVLRLYFIEGLSLQSIGTLLGVTESRVSQIKKEALIKLRGIMEFKESEND